MNRLYINPTLETDQTKLRMLNFDLMMLHPGAQRGGRQIWGCIAPCGAEVTAALPA